MSVSVTETPTKVVVNDPAVSITVGAGLRRLQDLDDVKKTAPTDGQVPIWVAANSRFEFGAPAGGGGGAPSGPAGGDLAGTYPNPTIGVGKVTSSHIADGTIVDADVAAANKDGVAGTASLRTLGTGAQQAAAGNDSRLSDSRAPSGAAGGDLAGTYPNPTIGLLKVITGYIADLAVTTAKLAAGAVTTAKIATGAVTDNEVAAANKDGVAGTASLRTLGTGAQQAAAGNDSRLSDARTPTGHHVTHEPGGSDPMAVDAAAATGSLRTLGTGAAQAAAGNDSRFSDARTPTAHKDTHKSGGSDAFASGDLLDAVVKRLRESSGPTDMLVGSVSDGQFLKRSGTSIIGAAAGGAVATDVIWDTKGDLAVATGADTAVKLPAGANWNESLISDSTATGGLRWARPRDLLRPTGAIRETFPRRSGANFAGALVSQRITLVAIDLYAGEVVTTITFMSGGTAMVTGVNQWAGLHDKNRARLALSSDLGATAWGSNASQVFTLTSPYTVTTSDLYYISILVNATTVPTLIQQDGSTTTIGIAPILCGTADTGVTAIPATPAALTALGRTVYAYAS